MDNYKKELIEEHAELFNRVDKLHNYIYSNASNEDNKIEFANKCIQLASMKKYLECLEIRLANVGVYFENGEYVERIAHIRPRIEPIQIVPVHCDCGKDFDMDTIRIRKRKHKNKKRKHGKR